MTELPAPFTTAAAEAIPGPSWLRERRKARAAQADALPLPTDAEEVWRYSRIGELDLASFTPANVEPVAADAATRPLDGLPGAVGEILAAVPERSATVVVHNGQVVALQSDGTVVVGVPGASDAPVEAVGAVAGDEPKDLFAALNDALTTAPLVVSVPAGVTVARPVLVINWVDQPGIAVFPRLVVSAGANAQVDVIDHHGSADGTVALSVPLVELDLGHAARVGYVNVQNLAIETWQIANQLSKVEADATLRSTVAAFGGDYARQRADCKLAGRGASGYLDAIYFGEGTQHLDFRTFQDHAAPDTHSDLLFKGALDGASRSVYTGLIRVREEGKGTNAFQTNRNIKLSEQAWAESVPNLEIHNNDVHCSHASTVGPVDEDQRFYLESRGVPTNIAERLVVSGFFDEVLGRLAVADTASELRSLVGGKLDRRESTSGQGEA